MKRARPRSGGCSTACRSRWRASPPRRANIGSSCAKWPRSVTGRLLDVTSSDTKGMYKEGREFHKLGKDIVIKLPMTPDGMRVVRLLAQDQIAVNITLCFSAAQALIVGKAGAAYVSPFVGGLDDIGAIGMDLIEQMIRIYDNYGFQTLVLVESVRNPVHVLDAALMGADVATISFPIVDSSSSTPDGNRPLSRSSRGRGARRPPS